MPFSSIKAFGAAPFSFIRDRLVRGKYRQGPLIAFIAAFVVLIGIFDIVTGPYFGLSIFYLIPVALAAWHISEKAGIVTAVACAGMWFFADLLTQVAGYYLVLQIWNAAVRLGLFTIVAALVANVRRLTANLEETVHERTTELRHEIAERRKLEQELIGLIRRHERAVAHELHDGLAQFLTGVSCKAKLLEQDLEESASPYAHSAHEIARFLNEATAQTRSIARGLDPVEVEANELCSALQRLAAETSGVFQIDCTLDVDDEPLVVDGLTGLHLYRIAQQAIDNAIRHGDAKHISIDLRRHGTDLLLSISDDGRGFNPAPHLPSGLGLRSMKFRAELLGGELTIASAEATGTRVECRIPETHPTQS
ncbi:sensor histidine kinase [Verrucomicrobiota bacterium sgz303538]